MGRRDLRGDGLISLFNFSGRIEAASGLPIDEVPEGVRMPETTPEKR